MHVAGGIADNFPEVGTFVRAVRDVDALGGGLYDLHTTHPQAWPILRRLRSMAVHQVVRSHAGELLSETDVTHTYTFRGDLVAAREQWRRLAPLMRFIDKKDLASLEKELTAKGGADAAARIRELLESGRVE